MNHETTPEFDRLMAILGAVIEHAHPSSPQALVSALASTLISLLVSGRIYADSPELVTFIDGLGDMYKALAACTPEQVPEFQAAHRPGVVHH